MNKTYFIFNVIVSFIAINKFYNLRNKDDVSLTKFTLKLRTSSFTNLMNENMN